MLATDRVTAICTQERVTGIDFIEVVDPNQQDVLRVFFLVDPDGVIDPGTLDPMVDRAALPLPFDETRVSIRAEDTGSTLPDIEVKEAIWKEMPPAGSGRIILEIKVAHPGDFSTYRFSVDHPLIDRFFNHVEFSFKQGCPTRYDCREKSECIEDPQPDVPIDYMARDFESFRSALLDFAAQRFPHWGIPVIPDGGMMIAELMAALGDEFSYIQDGFALEAHLETATQRRSLNHFSRLVNYTPDPGGNAATWLSLFVQPTQGLAINGQDRVQVWAAPEGEEIIPFEIGEGLHDEKDYWIHSRWNSMNLHNPDPGVPNLPVGATELYLGPGENNGPVPAPADLPAGPGITVDTFWVGRWMILQSIPADPSVPSRRWAIQIEEVEILEDPLLLDENGLPTPITRVKWSDGQALNFELCIRETVLLGNIVPAIAGETISSNTGNYPSQDFRVGPDEDFSIEQLELPRAVEREGIFDELSRQDLNDSNKGRPLVVIHGIELTVEKGLAWKTERVFQNHLVLVKNTIPEILLQEITNGDLQNPTFEKWSYVPSLLQSSEQSRDFTLEAGLWNGIVRYERSGVVFVHKDYSGSEGYSIRFGDGFLGRRPGDGALFRLTWRTNPGLRANLAEDSIVHLVNPEDKQTRSAPPQITQVNNPLPVTEGRNPEPLENIKQVAPEAFRLFPQRAVLDQDYRDILNRIPWVQTAGANGRYTGSWISEFVTADPRDTFELSDNRVEELFNEANCIRQAGREVHVVQPLYVPVDLDITICVEPSSFSGQVSEAVMNRLSFKPGSSREGVFFHPDNFTFGTPLRRSDLEATIQSVPGVLGVKEICLRARNVEEWMLFEMAEYRVGLSEIIQVRNDPNFPVHGSIQIRIHGGVPSECAS